PAFQYPIHFQPQVVMQSPGLVPLNHKLKGSLLLFDFPLWFRSLGKIPLLDVVFKSHQEAFFLFSKLAFNWAIRSLAGVALDSNFLIFPLLPVALALMIFNN